MPDTVILGAYWGARAETPAEAAGHLHACLEAIAASDDRLGHWYALARRPVATSPIDTSKEGLARRLETGRHRREIGGSVIEGLGYSMGAWNGQRRFSASLDVQCGMTASVAGLTNAFVVGLDDAFDLTIDDGWVERMLDAMVAAWTPDRAVVTTRRILNAGLAVSARQPPGMATYDSDRRTFDARRLPAFVVTRPVGPGSAVQVRLEPRDDLEQRVAELARLLGPR